MAYKQLESGCSRNGGGDCRARKNRRVEAVSADGGYRLAQEQEIQANPALLKGFAGSTGPNFDGETVVGKIRRKFGYNFRGLGARGVHSSDNGDSANLPNWHRGENHV